MVAVPAMTRVAASTMLLRRGLRARRLRRRVLRLRVGTRGMSLGAGGLCLGAGCLRPCLHLGSRGLGLRARLARGLAPRLLLGLGASGLRLPTRLLLPPCASGLGRGTGLRLGLTASVTLRLHVRCAGGLGSDALLFAPRLS